MREIKFRAWDKSFSVMKNDSYTKNLLCNFSGDYTQYFEVMQYTGLKDKNGKEIFEGDVVSDGSLSGTYGSMRSYTPTVEYVEGCFVVKCEEGCASDHVFDNYHLLRDLIGNGTECEVVGNVWES